MAHGFSQENPSQRIARMAQTQMHNAVENLPLTGQSTALERFDVGGFPENSGTGFGPLTE
jgi:hypothetical protein